MKKIYYFILLCIVSILLCTPIRSNDQQLYAAEDVVEDTTILPLQIEIIGNIKNVAPEVTIQIRIQSDSAVTDIRYAALRANDITYFTQKEKGVPLILTDDHTYTMTIAKNGFYSFYVKNAQNEEIMKTVYVSCIDAIAPEIVWEAEAQQSNGMYQLSLRAKDRSQIVSFSYLQGAYAGEQDFVWNTATPIEKDTLLLAPGKYSFRAVDAAGNITLEIRYIGYEPEETEELKAVWISYLEFSDAPYTEASWKKQINTMFNQVAEDGMNAVIVQVRPFSDAFYPSAYYPWSSYLTGTQGKDPGFDPLQYMVTAAHKRGLEIHAWLNPYRITSNTTDVTTLSKDHPARIWLTDSKKANDRNVLSYGGKLYYNPASEEVRKLIVNGVKELVENYNIDGIHFDDYFYPTLGKDYKKNFDAQEYKTYCKNQEITGQTALSIADWRRENVNILVRSVYDAVKDLDETVQFGISPGGFIDYLTMDDRYYVDYETWLGYDGYIDYLCPQLYWSNSHSKFPFNETLQRFIDARKNPDVKIYVGIAAYKAGIKSEEADWYKDKNILMNMIRFSRNTNDVDGFMFFRYDFFVSKSNHAAIKNMLKELNRD